MADKPITGINDHFHMTSANMNYSVDITCKQQRGRSACTYMQVYQDQPVHTCRFIRTQISLYIHADLSGSACTYMQVYQDQPVHTCRFIRISLYIHAGLSGSACTYMQVYQDQPVHTCRFIRISLYIHAGLSGSACTYMQVYQDQPVHTCRFIRSACIYKGRSKSNKTRVTAPFIKSVDKR